MIYIDTLTSKILKLFKNNDINDSNLYESTEKKLKPLWEKQKIK